jgi:hypothetical protein
MSRASNTSGAAALAERMGAEEPRSEAKPAGRKHRGRRPLEREIPRRRIEILPAEADRSCTCCGTEKAPNRRGGDRGARRPRFRRAKRPDTPHA